MIEVTLMRVQYETVSVNTTDLRYAANIVARSFARSGEIVTKVGNVPVIGRCDKCRVHLLEGDAAIKSGDGEVFCDRCYQPEYDVVEPETEACDAVS